MLRRRMSSVSTGQGWAELWFCGIGCFPRRLPARCADCWSTVLAALDRLGGGLLARRGTAIGVSWWQGGREGTLLFNPGCMMPPSGNRDCYRGSNVEKNTSTHHHPLPPTTTHHQCVPFAFHLRSVYGTGKHRKGTVSTEKERKGNATRARFLQEKVP